MASSMINKTQPLLSVETTVLDNQTVAPSYASFSLDTSRSGKSAIGVLGVSITNATTSGSGSSWCVARSWYVVQSTGVFYTSIRNFGSTDAKIKISVTVLYSDD